MRFQENSNRFDLAQIVDQAFTFTVKDQGHSERVHTLRVEAANTNRRGDTQLLVRKCDENGIETMQWVDFRTFAIWWQLYRQAS